MFPFGMSDKAEEIHALLQGRKQRRKPHLVARKRSQYHETVFLILSLNGATDQKCIYKQNYLSTCHLCSTGAFRDSGAGAGLDNF